MQLDFLEKSALALRRRPLREEEVALRVFTLLPSLPACLEDHTVACRSFLLLCLVAIQFDSPSSPSQLEFPNMPLAKDLLHPTPAEERRKCKLKRLVPHPNSFFMDIKCPGCLRITTVFSHAQSKVECKGCTKILCTPTGGKARLTDGCSFRKKQH